MKSILSVIILFLGGNLQQQSIWKLIKSNYKFPDGFLMNLIKNLWKIQLLRIKNKLKNLWKPFYQKK